MKNIFKNSFSNNIAARSIFHYKIILKIATMMNENNVNKFHSTLYRKHKITTLINNIMNIILFPFGYLCILYLIHNVSEHVALPLQVVST